ncbi:MAG: type II toxin-antitoxin system RelE/ParE family toxin [Gemmatimonadaceae bacterium]|nr:type II toxin-antitoxin system RelE/ParE family toxin [Gemmatimonadaceae bacterium]
MRVEYAHHDYRRLAEDPQYTHGFGPEVVRAYRKRIGFLLACVDERDIYQMKSLHFEKLSGNRAHQRSIRLNAQFRLVFEIRMDANGKLIVVIEVVDYH